MNDLEQRRRRMVDVTAEDHMRGGIAAWQRVERVFRDIERENQLILRAAGEGIYGVNAEGKTTFVNPVAERILGWSAEELVGTDIHSTVHHTHHDGRHYPHTDCPIYAAFRDGAVHQVNDEVFWRKDGTPVWVEYTSTPIRDRGVVVGAVIVFRDVSQRREADENCAQRSPRSISCVSGSSRKTPICRRKFAPKPIRAASSAAQPLCRKRCGRWVSSRRLMRPS
jgi:PAS domain S-box-containing protein